MKLCKDCKHAHMPHPLQQISGNYYGVPMCAHPEAPRDCVEGRLALTCAGARGVPHQLQMPSFCGEDARLFEERPAPEPAPDAGSIVWVQAESDLKIGWFARLLGW